MAIDRQRLIKEAFDEQGIAASSEFYRGWAVCPDAAEAAYNRRPPAPCWPRPAGRT